MPDGDFLNRRAETSLCQHYVAAGAICSLSTNSEFLLETAADTFETVRSAPDEVDFSVRVWVDNADLAQPPWPGPYVRGLDHLVFAGFDARSSLLADLRTRRVIGRFSAVMAADAAHWKTVVFPVLLSIVAGSVGLVELHASCVAKDGLGMILAGPSRAGKSTLAMALTESGFRLLSDDRVFCSQPDGQLFAWGLPRPLKLRPEAATWFERFCGQAPPDIQNGEPVFHCYPSPQRTATQCKPRLLLFLERVEDMVLETVSFEMIPMQSGEARSRLEADLLAEVPEAICAQEKSLKTLCDLPCYLLRYAGRPQLIAERLAAVFAEHCVGQRLGEQRSPAS